MNEATRKLITELLPVIEKHNALVSAFDGELIVTFSNPAIESYGCYEQTAEECREFIDMDQAEKRWFS